MDKLYCRFRKVKNNILLNRVQLVVDCFHPREMNVSKEQLREAIRAKFKKNHVLLVNVKKLFGGGRTKGMALVYDNEESMKKVETYRRIDREAREKLAPKDRKKSQPQGKKKEGRKVKKIKKHKNQKEWGTKKSQEKRLAAKQARKGN